MNAEETLPAPNGISPFERIRRTNAAGPEYWSSRDFAQVLGYSDYRNFGQVILKARAACFNSGQRIEDHSGEITEMVEIGIMPESLSPGENRTVESRTCQRPEALERPPDQMEATRDSPARGEVSDVQEHLACFS